VGGCAGEAVEAVVDVEVLHVDVGLLDEGGLGLVRVQREVRVLGAAHMAREHMVRVVRDH
jgi:hypothetical protein